MYRIWLYISYYLRPIIKWFLRKTTGLCELQRICYGEKHGAPRIYSVEKSLMLSRNPHIKQVIQHLDDVSSNCRFLNENREDIVRGVVNTVLIAKKINPKIHFQFVTSFGQCVEKIWGYRQLLSEIENLRNTQYDSDNFEHEIKLLSLWNHLMPDSDLDGRITKQWQIIGFQGDDPKTDFRGMGMLGLENLLYFATEYKNAALHVLSHSHHPKYGYTFAIVGINLTSMAWKLMKDGSAKTYIYNSPSAIPALNSFHQFYSYLFYEFDKYWIGCKPENIMEFSNIKKKFELNIRTSLQDPSTVFRINIHIDTI